MRYIVLLLLNLPIALLALANIVTQFKMKKMSKNRFRKQIGLWVVIITVIVGSFPVYNTFAGNPILDSSELSLFDIAQTTIIVFLIYIANAQRLKLDRTERRLRDLHQEVSILLSDKKL